MMQTGYLFGAWHLFRAAAVAQDRLAAGSDNPFYAQKVATANFYAEALLPRTRAHGAIIASEASALDAFAEEWLA